MVNGPKIILTLKMHLKYLNATVLFNKISKQVAFTFKENSPRILFKDSVLQKEAFPCVHYSVSLMQ